MLMMMTRMIMMMMMMMLLLMLGLGVGGLSYVVGLNDGDDRVAAVASGVPWGSKGECELVRVMNWFWWVCLLVEDVGEMQWYWR